MSDWDRALDAMSFYEEFNITPRKRVLIEFYDILVENGKETPFERPVPFVPAVQADQPTIESTESLSLRSQHQPKASILTDLTFDDIQVSIERKLLQLLKITII